MEGNITKSLSLCVVPRKIRVCMTCSVLVSIVLDFGSQVFGQILLSNWKERDSDGFLFNSWVPDSWNSYCFLANSETKTVQAFLNNKKIFERFQYEGQHRDASTSVFLLNSKSSESPVQGSLTDLQIWNRNLSVAGNVLLY